MIGAILRPSLRLCPMEQAQTLFFRDQLRSARAVALADVEGFYAVLRVVEMIGQQLNGKISMGVAGY